MAVFQLDPASGRPIAYVGTFLVASGFYGVTAVIATRFVLSRAYPDRGVLVGALLGLVSLLLQQFGPVVVLPVTVGVDVLAIRTVYSLDLRTATIVTVIHFTVAVILGITVFNLVRLLGTAPG